MPRVSIGLPVYNGEKYLPEAIESFLGQTFEDFELIISDNASMDRTQEICESFMLQDPRIRYYRNQENRGAAWNYNHVFELSESEFFKWAAHDDLCAPTCLERSVAALEQQSSVIVAYPRTLVIDEKGTVIDERYDSLPITASTPCERFKQCLWNADGGIEKVFGVIRSSALKKTGLIGPFNSADRILLAELALLGKFCEIPEQLFFRREHPETSARVNANPIAYAAWYDPANKGIMVFPRFRRTWEYMKRVMFFADLHILTRVCCLLHLGRWIWWVKPALFQESGLLVRHIFSLRSFERHS